MFYIIHLLTLVYTRWAIWCVVSCARFRSKVFYSINSKRLTHISVNRKVVLMILLEMSVSKWYVYKPESVRENVTHKNFWGSEIQTSYKTPASTEGNTPQGINGHQPPITETIQVRRTRHAGHWWRNRNELISDALLWTPTYGRAKAGRPARTYIQ